MNILKNALSNSGPEKIVRSKSGRGSHDFPLLFNFSVAGLASSS